MTVTVISRAWRGDLLCIEATVPKEQAHWQRVPVSTDVLWEKGHYVDLKIHVGDKYYLWGYACGWQVSDPEAYTRSGLRGLVSFNPRVDSFLGEVLQELGVKTK